MNMESLKEAVENRLRDSGMLEEDSFGHGELVGLITKYAESNETDRGLLQDLIFARNLLSVAIDAVQEWRERKMDQNMAALRAKLDAAPEDE